MSLVDNFRTLPTSQEAQAFWVGQQGGWDCWLSSLRMALRFWDYDFEYAHLLSQLLKTQLRISKIHGAFFPYIAFIASCLEFHGWLGCPLKNLPALAHLISVDKSSHQVKLEHPLLQEVISLCKQMNHSHSYLYESLSLLLGTSFASTYTIFHTSDRPSFQDITHFLRLGVPLVVQVRCDKYYQLLEDSSNHTLTVIPVSDAERGYVVFDGYRERGYHAFAEWEQHLIASDNYDWAHWSDWLLAIVPLDWKQYIDWKGALPLKP